MSIMYTDNNDHHGLSGDEQKNPRRGIKNPAQAEKNHRHKNKRTVLVKNIPDWPPPLRKKTEQYPRAV